jgi:C-terminal processing protease CtpA/Prc
MGNSVASILKDLTNSTLMGERSGGGSGSIIPVLLGNGWCFQYTVSKTLNLAMELTEDGINPDIEVVLPIDYWDTTHQEMGIDPQLDKAIEILLIN